MEKKHAWGGYRPGSGRRPKGEVSGVSHHAREALSPRHPVLVIMRTKPELGNLRRQRVHAVIRGALTAGNSAGSNADPFRICHYALRKHGLLLLVEVRDSVALSRGMQGINVRVAKALNRLWERNGSAFADRYGTVVLRSAAQVRDGLCYLLNHARLHERLAQGKLDPFSSAAYFDGWADLPAPVPRPGGPAPVAPPQTRLLEAGWRKHGLVGVNEVPSRLLEPTPAPRAARERGAGPAGRARRD